MLLAKHEEFFNGEILKTKIFTRFIKGNQKEGRIIATLIGNPEVIILMPFLQETTQFQIIKELAADPNVTLSSHDLLHTVEVSDRIVAMHKGEVKDIQTSPETLQEQFFAV
jgi:ABC-2 type transport system ATP-binding protein